MNRVAFVTGAARGIGAATVKRLVAGGYSVTAVDICSGGHVPTGVGYPLATPEDLALLEDRYGDQVMTLEVDVRDLPSLRDAVNTTLERFGRVDVAVAAAGVVVGGMPLWETPPEHLSTLLQINVEGVWNTAAAVVPGMLAGPDVDGCRFVAIASAAGDRGLFHLAGYSASKHAVIGVVRGLAADLVGTGITAVAVSPGSTDTAMLAATADLYAATPAELASHQGLRRLIRPE